MKAQSSFKNVLMQRKGTIHAKVMEHLRTSHLLPKCPKVESTTGNIGLCSELFEFMAASLSSRLSEEGLGGVMPRAKASGE